MHFLREELTLCLETHQPSMFIFDGAFPYRRMLRAVQGRENLNKVWMRRGMFRKGAKSQSIASNISMPSFDQEMQSTKMVMNLITVLN